jgi:hypothetical protein
MSIRLRGDFNGVWATPDGGILLCLSHGETAEDEEGRVIFLEEGMTATAFDEDADENGNRDDLIANGVVVKSPDWLQCYGSKWALEIDGRGYHHESEAAGKS